MKKNIVLSLLFLVTCNVALFAADEKSLDNSPSSKKRSASPFSWQGVKNIFTKKPKVQPKVQPNNRRSASAPLPAIPTGLNDDNYDDDDRIYSALLESPVKFNKKSGIVCSIAESDDDGIYEPLPVRSVTSSSIKREIVFNEATSSSASSTFKTSPPLTPVSKEIIKPVLFSAKSEFHRFVDNMKKNKSKGQLQDSLNDKKRLQQQVRDLMYDNDMSDNDMSDNDMSDNEINKL